MLMCISASINCPHSNVTKPNASLMEFICSELVASCAHMHTHTQSETIKNPNRMGGLIKPSNWKHQLKPMKSNESFEIFTYLFNVMQRFVDGSSALIAASNSIKSNTFNWLVKDFSRVFPSSSSSSSDLLRRIMQFLPLFMKTIEMMYALIDLCDVVIHIPLSR